MKKRLEFRTCLALPRRQAGGRRISDFGFTLIELLVVVSIIGVLSAVGIVSFRNAAINARNGKRQTDIETVRQALVLYRADNSQYPDPGTSGESAYLQVAATLQAGGYLDNQGLGDPLARDAYYYSYETTDSGRTFELCACLEPGGTGASCESAEEYCVSNP